MPYKRRYRKRRKHRKSSHKKIKSIVKKEINKTVETQKMVSYLSWSQIPALIDSATGGGQGLLLSLTGGLNPQNTQTVQTPQSYVDTRLFTLLPAGVEATTTPAYTNNVQQAGEGGVAMLSSTVSNDSNSIGGIYSLEGREAYLKNWYATCILSNESEFVEAPASAWVRLLVFETRRPLAPGNLAQQIFLQNHAVAKMNLAVNDEPETVCSYLNRDNIKKVYRDKLIRLVPTADAQNLNENSRSTYSYKFKVKINKKCRWSYYYATEDPSPSRASLSYQGPFLYALFCSNRASANQFPTVAMNTMLTFQDD